MGDETEKEEIEVTGTIMEAAIAFLRENNLLDIRPIKHDEIEQKYADYRAWCIELNVFPWGKDEFSETLHSIDASGLTVDIKEPIHIENNGEMIQNSILAFLESQKILLAKKIDSSKAMSLVNDYPITSGSSAVLMTYMYKFGIINIKILLDFLDSYTFLAS